MQCNHAPGTWRCLIPPSYPAPIQCLDSVCKLEELHTHPMDFHGDAQLKACNCRCEFSTHIAVAVMLFCHFMYSVLQQNITAVYHRGIGTYMCMRLKPQKCFPVFKFLAYKTCFVCSRAKAQLHNIQYHFCMLCIITCDRALCITRLKAWQFTQCPVSCAQGRLGKASDNDCAGFMQRH